MGRASDSGRDGSPFAKPPFFFSKPHLLHGPFHPFTSFFFYELNDHDERINETETEPGSRITTDGLPTLGATHLLVPFHFPFPFS